MQFTASRVDYAPLFLDQVLIPCRTCDTRDEQAPTRRDRMSEGIGVFSVTYRINIRP